MISRRSSSLSNGFSRMIAQLRAGRLEQGARTRRSKIQQAVNTLPVEALETRALLSAVVVSSNVSMTGDVEISSTDEAAAGDNLTVNAGVTVESTAGSVTLNAGDDLILLAGSSINANGPIVLNLDAADADVGVGSSATLSGQLTAATASVVGGADADSITAAPSAFLTTPLNIDGGAGVDSFEVD